MQLHNRTAPATDIEGNADGSEILAMGTLLTGMNHDIRTSINGVRGMLELLLNTGLSPAQQQYARTAQQNVDNLLESLERIVDMSLIESKQFRLHQVPFDLLREMKAAWEGKPAIARTKAVALSIVYPEALLLLGDATRLRAAASGLVDLALQCAAEGEMRVSAHTAPTSAGSCRIDLAAHVSRLSAEGEQLSSLVGHPHPEAPAVMQAVGKESVGLALCAGLVRLMGGTLSVERPDSGAVFRFSVELPIAARGEAAVPRSAGATPPLEEGELPRQSYSGCTVLVADDNPVNQQVAARMLEKFGCKIALATDGRQAVDMQGARPFDLILMDCEMPVLDGLTATRLIREAESNRRTPIIALTACTGQGEQEQCFAAGMDDFLAKPLRPEMLQDVLGRWLTRSGGDAGNAAAPACSDELEAVCKIFGADFAELAALYRNDGSPRLEAIRDAYGSGDLARVAKVAHAFAGSSASIGATGLSALGKDMETRAKAGSVEEFERRMAAIEAEYGRICDKLQILTRP